jgi:hypothetical protein
MTPHEFLIYLRNVAPENLENVPTLPEPEPPIDNTAAEAYRRQLLSALNAAATLPPAPEGNTAAPPSRRVDVASQEIT